MPVYFLNFHKPVAAGDHENNCHHTRPLALACREPYHWAGRVDFGAVNVLVEVETDEGITGYGESTAARPADGVISALRGVASLFVGESPFDVERLMSRARFDPEFIEQPTPALSLVALRQVKEAVSIPIAADQSVYTLGRPPA